MMEISESLIRSIANDDSIRRALRIYQRGCVTIQQTTRAHVKGLVKSGSAFNVELWNRSGTIETSCTCPVDWDGECRHVVAVMMALLYNGQQARQTAVSINTPWRTAINHLLPLDAAEGHARRAMPPSRVAYLLSVHNHHRSIVPLRIRTLKNGADAKPSVLKQYDPNDTEHIELTDRILLEKINGNFSMLVVEKSNLPSSPENFNAGAKGNDALMTDLLTLMRGREVYRSKKDGTLGSRIEVTSEEGRIRLDVQEHAHGLDVCALLRFRDRDIDIADCIVMCTTPLWLFNDSIVFRAFGAGAAQVLAFQKMKRISVPVNEREIFLRTGLPLLLPHYSVNCSRDFLQTIDVDPVPRLYLRECSGTLTIELRFQYNGFEVLPVRHALGNSEYDTLRGQAIHILRRRKIEKECIRMLFDTGVTESTMDDSADCSLMTPRKDPLEWLAVQLPLFRQAGFEIFGQEQLKRYRLRTVVPKAVVSVCSGIDWLDISVDVAFEHTHAPMEAIALALQKHERFVKLEDGSYGILPEAWVRKFDRVLALASNVNGSLRLSKTQTMIIDDFVAEIGEVVTDDQYTKFRERLRSFETIREVPLPKHMTGSLRPYQQAGYQWMHFLQEFGFGGILADDMGLGKTIQTLAILQDARERHTHHVSLVIVPTSLVFNWENEAHRFAPCLRVYSHRGAQRNKHHGIFDSIDLVITSYGIMRRDIGFLSQFHFHYVILDESQNIKNTHSVNAKTVRMLKADFRLALSGTPVENNLAELWSQFAFLNPGMLGSLRSFLDQYARPIEKDHDVECAQSLRRLLHPFILRRTKEVVAGELPPKQELIVYCEMESEQRKVYTHWREYYRHAVTQSIKTVGVQKSTIKVLEGLTTLRQVCCHPSMIDANYQGSSGKYETFTEMLDDILAEGHKALVFSQYVKMLKILRQHCDSRGMVYEYLDGHTHDREDRVNRFQNDDSVRLFLISLKAGGTGLNLTGADYVFHYDPWWNPAVEMQATDRTHRIGQTKKVFSYKLITKDTVEEKILVLQEKKKALVRDIISTDSGVLKSLTREDIDGLFG